VALAILAGLAWFAQLLVAMVRREGAALAPPA